MYVKIRFNGVVYMIADLSRQSKVTKLRQKVEEKTGVPPHRQRLIHKGKQLEDDYTLFDYDVKINDFIEMMERTVVIDEKKGQKDHVVDKENVSDNVRGEMEPEDLEDEATTSQATSSAGEVIKLEDIYKGDIKDLDLKEGPECKKCKDDVGKLCGECGCVICRKKDRPEDQLMCDQCEYYYHFGCLDPPLDSVPDDDWYCPDCKNDTDEIVGAGAKLKVRKSKAKMPSQVGKSKRDWGNGFATAGRSKSCTKVPSNHFGPIPGIEVGMTWKFRLQVSEEGIHRPPVAGIAGKPTEGAYSIVLAGGYEDDTDHGDEFYYTGAGGRDLSGNKRTSVQSFDQELTKTNLALAVSCHTKSKDNKGGDAGDKWKKGKPIRVIRSDKLKKHSKYAPEEGCRYDGIYKVVKYWSEKGKSGFLVWRYLFRRDDDSPAPWTKEGKKIIQKNGYTCIYPEGFEAAQAEKLKNKNKKADEEVDATVTPPPEKRLKQAYEVDKDLMALIATEEKNGRIWDIILSSDMSTKLDFTNLVEEHFLCSMCQYVLYKPVTTRCGHNFCKECFFDILKKSETKACPNCRQQLDEEDNLLNDVLSKILLLVFPGYDQDR